MSSTPPSKLYKTLPGPLRREERKKNVAQDHSHSPLFGLNLNLSFSNLISSGVNFFDNLRKKTPTTPQSSATDSSSPSLALSFSLVPHLVWKFEQSWCRGQQRALFQTLGEPMPLKRIHSLTYRWLHVLQPEIIFNMFSSVSGSGTTSLCEAIEMQPLFIGPGADGEAGSGLGHDWGEIPSHHPAWCDLCGELIWGLYDTGAWQCGHCSYTAHLKCREMVRLDCSAAVLSHDRVEELSLADEDDTDGNISSLPHDEDEEIPSSSYTTAKASTSRSLCLSDTSDTLVGEEEFHTLQDVEDLTPDNIPSLLSLPPEQVELFIQRYNFSMPGGQGTAFCPDRNLYSGYIRVEMNLARPINVISGTRPPSIYNIMSEDTINDRTLTTFYLPPGTEKALHITSLTTTQDVVRVLLKKFRVADNPHKFSLYERNMNDYYRRDSFPKSKSLSRLKLRRLNEEEKPLMLALLWMKDPDCTKKFVLQENDPGEIQWEQFSLPELKNFLLILDREEAWYKRRIHEKYENVHQTVHTLLQEKRPDKDKDKDVKGKEYVY